MDLTRRDFLLSASAAASAPLLGLAPGAAIPAVRRPAMEDWAQVRGEFDLAPDYIHLAGLLLASHPRPVQAAIARHRLALDANPTLYAQENRWAMEQAARMAAARYLGARWEDIALVDSTTMGLGLIYAGIKVRPDQELLTTDQDYYSTHQSLRYKQRDAGATWREIRLFDRTGAVSEDEIVATLMAGIRPHTRVLALTWVHSKTGLKLPARAIADALRDVNRDRDGPERVLFCLDGVHGLGVEDFTLEELGCDFFAAGTHKWLFGPRGTGIIWGSPRRQRAVATLIPTFTPDGTWGGRMTPGGFKPFEHQWALPAAFEFHEALGKARVMARVHELNRQLKEGLAKMPRVKVYTPMDARLSSGIVCFDVDGLRPDQVVQRLRARRIIASVTPYSPPHARFTAAVFNSPAEIDAALAAVRALA